MNLKLNPVLYKNLCSLRRTFGFRIVPTRGKRRPNANSVDVIITSPLIESLSGRLNSLKEAEACGYWIICRARRGKRRTYKQHQIFQIFLSPVHPKKRLIQRFAAAQTPVEVTFCPVESTSRRTPLPVRYAYPLYMDKLSSLRSFRLLRFRRIVHSI